MKDSYFIATNIVLWTTVVAVVCQEYSAVDGKISVVVVVVVDVVLFFVCSYIKNHFYLFQ